MGLAPLVLAALHVSCWCLVAPAQTGTPGSPSAALLREEERDEHEHRTHFEEWCRSESASQAGHRRELLRAREQAAALEGSDVLIDTLSRQATDLAILLEHRRGEFTRLVQRRSAAALALQHLEKQVEALSSTKGQLERDGKEIAMMGRGGQSSFLEVQLSKSGSLKIVSELLQKAQSRQKQVASEVAKDPKALQREMDVLEFEYQSNTSGVAALKATRRAAQKLQELILSALENEDAFLADLGSICRLGLKVYGRMEAEIPIMLQRVLQLIAQSAEELRSSTTPATKPPPPPLIITARKAAQVADADSATKTVPTAAVPCGPALRTPNGLPLTANVGGTAARSPAVDPLGDLPHEAPASPAALPPPPIQPRSSRASMVTATAAVAMAITQRQQRLHAAEANSPLPLPQPQLPVYEGDDEAAMESMSDSPPQRLPARHAGSPERVATQPVALQLEVAPAPVEPPSLLPRTKATFRALDEEDKALGAVFETIEPAPPAHGHRGYASVAVASTPLSEELEMDPASDIPVPPEPRRNASPRQRGTAEAKSVEAHFDDDDARGTRPIVSEKRHKQRTTASARDEEPADDEPAPARRKHHHAVAASTDADTIVEEQLAPSTSASSSSEASPKGMSNSLRGGWKAMMKGNKPSKHAFHDQTTGIMNLVQTPTTYTAWHPEHSDNSLAASAKNDLLAAEKAFDTSDAGGDGGATSLVQLNSSPDAASSASAEPGALIPLQSEVAEAEAQQSILPLPPTRQHVEDGPPPALLAVPVLPFAPLMPQPSTQLAAESSVQVAPAPPSVAGEAADAASLLLKQYAHSLGSASLMQLARSRPSLAGLQKLWRRLSARGNLAGNGHDAETSMWCQDFEHETEAVSRAASRVRSEAKTGLAAASAEHKTLEQEADVRKNMLEVFRLGSKSLTGMFVRVKKRGVSTSTLFKSLQDEVQELVRQNSIDRDANVSAQIALVQETVGRAEGLSTSGDVEVEDIISAAISRRAEVERMVQTGVAKLQARIHALDKRFAELGRAASPPAQQDPSQQSTNALREHYAQLCRWTLDGIQARKLHEDSEKDAIRAALAILETR